MTDLLRKSLNLLLRRQTNILSAAFIIMSTVILSQVLGLVRTRLLFSIFGASNILGIYNYASILPDTIFQLTVAAALASAFIPVFSGYLKNGQEKEGHKVASTLLASGLVIFSILSIILAIFSPIVLGLFNLGTNFTPAQMDLMVQLMRVIIVSQLLYVIATFFTALLQSYDHFFVPGIAAAFYNVGTIAGILLFHDAFGIYSVPMGLILGALIFVLIQIPLAKKIGFTFRPSLSHLKSPGVLKIVRLMWPRTIQIGVQQVGTIALAAIIGFMVDPGRMNVLFDAAKTLMFAPVSLVGFSLAQAAFPVLSREKDNLKDFKEIFLGSFNQMLFLILPISALIFVLRIPVVRLAFGAEQFDWAATVLTGRTLAFLSISIFAQALIALLSRAFYALHDTKTPLLTSAFSTVLLMILSAIFVLEFHAGIESIGIAFTIANISQLIILFIILDKMVGGFEKVAFLFTMTKYFFATVFTGFALYVPKKLLDQLVFDTTKTVNLLILTGISSFAGLSLYLFLAWVFNIKEASTYILLFKKVGNWREILGKSEEVIGEQR